MGVLCKEGNVVVVVITYRLGDFCNEVLDGRFGPNIWGKCLSYIQFEIIKAAVRETVLAASNHYKKTHL